jgi:hypothetical protein
MIEQIARDEVQTLDGSERGRARARDQPGMIEVPRILYHGTTFGYLNLEPKRQYPFFPGRKYLTGNYHQAMGYGSKRAQQYNSAPVVLVIDSRKLTSAPRSDRGTCNLWIVDGLPTGSFEVVICSSSNGQLDWLSWQDAIKYWTTAIQGLSKEQVQRDNHDIFKHDSPND